MTTKSDAADAKADAEKLAADAKAEAETVAAAVAADAEKAKVSVAARVAAIEKRWGKSIQEVMCDVHDHVFGTTPDADNEVEGQSSGG